MFLTTLLTRFELCVTFLELLYNHSVRAGIARSKMADGAAARKLSSKRSVKSKFPRVPWTIGPNEESDELDMLVEVIVRLGAWNAMLRIKTESKIRVVNKASAYDMYWEPSARPRGETLTISMAIRRCRPMRPETIDWTAF